jgi:hypothetical protein
MHFKIACGTTIAVVVFAITSAVGNKIPYEAALTGMLAVLTYWSQAPSMGRQAREVQQIEAQPESSGEGE